MLYLFILNLREPSTKPSKPMIRNIRIIAVLIVAIMYNPFFILSFSELKTKYHLSAVLVNNFLFPLYYFGMMFVKRLNTKIPSPQRILAKTTPAINPLNDEATELPNLK
jgi:hypothetical protein